MKISHVISITRQRGKTIVFCSCHFNETSENPMPCVENSRKRQQCQDDDQTESKHTKFVDDYQAQSDEYFYEESEGTSFLHQDEELFGEYYIENNLNNIDLSFSDDEREDFLYEQLSDHTENDIVNFEQVLESPQSSLRMNETGNVTSNLENDM